MHELILKNFNNTELTKAFLPRVLTGKLLVKTP